MQPYQPERIAMDELPAGITFPQLGTLEVQPSVCGFAMSTVQEVR